MSEPESKSRVSLEDLLRLKRAEQPSAEFWSQFERELREKQLAALVEKRVWWQEWPRWAARHAYLPMGAAAALAFAFVTIRNQHTSPLATGETVTSVTVERAIEPTPAREAVPVNLAPAEFEAPVVADVVQVLAADEVPAMADTVPGDVAEMIPWSAPRVVADSPSARSIAENLARLEETAPELLHSVRGNHLAAVTARLQPERTAMELASVTVGASSAPRRSNRLLVGYEERDFSPEPAAPEQVRQRIARRLGDPDLAEEVRRLDVKANRLSLKL